MASPEATSGLLQEGWLLKRSKTLHVWRRRWASLWDETKTAAGPRSTPLRSARLLFSPEKKMYNDTSEVFHLSQVLGVCEANLDTDRTHCFVFQYQEKSQVRLVGLQAADAQSLESWLAALLSRMGTALSRAPQGELPTLLESSPIAVSPPAAMPAPVQPVQPAGGDGTVEGKGNKGAKPTKGPGKGKTKGGPPKGKGKGPPLPPPAESGKGKGKTQSKPLLFGKRLNLRDSGALPETARGERPQENIFQGLLRERAGRTQEDIDTLHSFFQPQQRSERSERTPSSGRPLTPGSMVGTPRAVFDDKVARNCAIVLRKLPLKGLELVRAVELLEPGPLDQDQLERLSKVMPDQAHMAQLKLASQQKDPPLRDVEQAMAPFAQLGRLQERLKALTLAANLVPSEQSFLAQLKKVSAACQEICDSHSLKNVLATVLVMYNYVNFGQVNRTDARAFDIANLLQLSEFRSEKGGPFPRFSALHYVAMRLLDETPQSARSLQEELSQVQGAAGVCLCSVEVYVKELRTDIQGLLEEQRANAKVYGGEEKPPTPPPPAPATPPRRGSILSEVTEGTDDEHITPRTSRIELPAQTPRCGARMAGWIRSQLGAPKPLELGELARGMPQQCLEPDELHLTFEGKGPMKASVSISNLGLLYIRELSAMGSPIATAVKAVPIIGSDVSLVSSPSFGEAIFEVAYSATPRVRRRVVLKAAELTAACRWQRALQQAAAGDGAGWLKVQNSLGFFRWSWATLLTVPLGRMSEVSLGSLVLPPGSRWLVWFRTPEDLLQGNVAGGVELAGTEVFSTDPRRFTFSVAHIKRERNTGREQMKQLVLRSGTDEDMKRWMRALRRPPQEHQVHPSPGRASQSSLQSDGTASGCAGGRQRISVPRLNLGKAETNSARSKGSSTSTEYSSPMKEQTGKAKAKSKDTLWTEIHRDIITPRPGMANAPRIVDRCLEDDSSSEDSDDSSSESASTVSVGDTPSAPPEPCTPELPLSRRVAPTARGGKDEVTTFSRMSALAEEAEALAQLLTRSLTETLEDGKRLLLFLGQKPPTETADLAVKVRSVFDTISKFVGQFKGAAAEVEKFQKRNNGGATTFSGENLGFYRRRKAADAAPKAVPKAAPKAAVAPTAQCKRLARDCVVHALFRACHPDLPAPQRCWERRVVGACRSPGRPPLLPPSPPPVPIARAGMSAEATVLSTLEELD